MYAIINLDGEFMKYIISNIENYSDKEIDSFYTKMHIAKKNKIAKYKSMIRKKQSIVGDILLKKLLNDYKIDYNNVDYVFNENGKPYLKDINLYYNISHSYNYVVIAVSKKEIGIDIEKIRKTNINSIDYFATEKEKEYILSSKEGIEKRLFQIYSLKEAYIKMYGNKLNNLKNIEFKMINNHVICNDPNIKIGFINDLNGYIITYCKKK